MEEAEVVYVLQFKDHEQGWVDKAKHCYIPEEWDCTTYKLWRIIKRVTIEEVLEVSENRTSSEGEKVEE